MQTSPKLSIRIFVIASLIALLSALMPARSATPASLINAYSLPWWTISSGGASFQQASGYSLGATAGQPGAAGEQNNGAYSLQSGFWYSAATDNEIYLPIIQRN